MGGSGSSSSGGGGGGRTSQQRGAAAATTATAFVQRKVVEVDDVDGVRLGSCSVHSIAQTMCARDSRNCFLLYS